MSSRTSGFLLAAAATVVFNTVLACAKDTYPQLNAAMKATTGHHWITHGLLDLIVFVVLGLFYWKTGWYLKISPNRLIGMLVGAVCVSSFGLVFWYALF